MLQHNYCLNTLTYVHKHSMVINKYSMDPPAQGQSQYTHLCTQTQHGCSCTVTVSMTAISLRYYNVTIPLTSQCWRHCRHTQRRLQVVQGTDVSLTCQCWCHCRHTQRRLQVVQDTDVSLTCQCWCHCRHTQRILQVVQGQRWHDWCRRHWRWLCCEVLLRCTPSQWQTPYVYVRGQGHGWRQTMPQERCPQMSGSEFHQA